MRDVSVDNQSGEESTKDALQSNECRQGCTDEHHSHDEDILHHRITIATQEIARQTGNNQDAAGTESGKFCHKQQPEQPPAILAECTYQSC